MLLHFKKKSAIKNILLCDDDDFRYYQNSLVRFLRRLNGVCITLYFYNDNDDNGGGGSGGDDDDGDGGDNDRFLSLPLRVSKRVTHTTPTE